MDSTTRQEFRRARELIAQKDYDRALGILQGMDHPQADQLIENLQSRMDSQTLVQQSEAAQAQTQTKSAPTDPPSEPEPQTPSKAPVAKNRLLGAPRWALSILFLNFFIWSMAGFIGFLWTSGDIIVIPITILSAIALGFVGVIAWYLHWRFYWTFWVIVSTLTSFTLIILGFMTGSETIISSLADLGLGS